MNRSVVFLTVKKDVNIIVEIDFNIVVFRVVHCKNNFSHKEIFSINIICRL